MSSRLRYSWLLIALAASGVMFASCGGGGNSTSTNAEVPLAKNSALKKGAPKPGTEKATTTTVGGTAAALNGVGREYRNSSGQVVDGLGNVVTALPATWPNALGADSLRLVTQAAERQLSAAIHPLTQQADTWKSSSATDVEKSANSLLTKYTVKWPKLPIGGGNNLEFAPVTSPITVRVQPNQWSGSSSMNLLVNLNFMGVRAYQIQIGCLSFTGDGPTNPTYIFNGGC